MIQVANLTKNFGQAEVLKNLTFSIGKSEVIGFLGPNGAGKTTTMRILTGFLSPTSGTVKIADLDVLTNALSARKKIGYLPENNPLYSEMRVYEYLKFIASTKDIKKPTEEIKRVIALCGLIDRIQQPISELSKGYKQRVGLAQSLLGDPDILILDEPTSGLDPNQIIEIRNLIKKIGERKTIILSTHILGEVQSTCTKAIIINNGKIVAQGTPDELVSQAQGKLQIRAVIKGGALEVKQRLAALASGSEIKMTSGKQPGENIFLFDVSRENGDIRQRIFDLCVHSGYSLLELERKVMSFEDVFASLTLTEERRNRET